jgi:ParB-like chromosome segregation protein Spo0J
MRIYKIAQDIAGLNARLEWVPVSKIEFTEFHQCDIEKIKKSLISMGWDKNKPAFCFEGNGSYSLQNGHHRVVAAMELGFKNAFCLVVDLDKAFHIMQDLGLDRAEIEKEARKQVGLSN